MDLKRACEVMDFLCNEYEGKTGEEFEAFNVRMNSAAMTSCLAKIGWHVKNEISEGGSYGLVSVKSFHREAGRYCQGARIQWENQLQYPLALARAVDSAIIALEREQFL